MRTKELIRTLPKEIQKAYYFGYIMQMADELSLWDETLEWFTPVRHIWELRQKVNEYEYQLEQLTEKDNE